MRVRIGRSDANKGFVFLNDGKGMFTYMPQNESGLDLTGDVRDLSVVKIKGADYLLVGRNGDALQVYEIGKTMPF